MKTCLYHVQINVGDATASIPFYRALFVVFFEDPDRLEVEIAHCFGVTDRRM